MTFFFTKIVSSVRNECIGYCHNHSDNKKPEKTLDISLIPENVSSKKQYRDYKPDSGKKKFERSQRMSTGNAGNKHPKQKKSNSPNNGIFQNFRLKNGFANLELKNLNNIKTKSKGSVGTKSPKLSVYSSIFTETGVRKAILRNVQVE